MDSLTHLAAGVLTPLAFPRTPVRAAVIGFGIAIGELPDMDFIFGVAPEARLVLHRGITHALFWQPVFVLLAVLPFYIWLQCKKPELREFSGEASGPGPAFASNGAPDFFTMYLMALAGVLIHLYLDSFTTFGTQIFLPFSDYRAGLPAMYIVDMLFTVPLCIFMAMALRARPDIVAYSPASCERADTRRGVAVVSEKGRRLALAGLAWALLYPLAALGVNCLATSAYATRLAPSGSLRLLPEPLSPFLWKAVVDEGDSYRVGTLNLFAPDGDAIQARYRKPDPAVYAALRGQVPIFGLFSKFCSYMVQKERPVSPLVQAGYSMPLREFVFVDIRYVLSQDSPARLVGLGEPYFVLEARVNDSGALAAWRFLLRGEADRDVPWTELQ